MSWRHQLLMIYLPNNERLWIRCRQSSSNCYCLVVGKNVQRALIYGSRAKGNFRSNSDIDIMVEGELLTIGDLSMIDARLDDLLLPWQIDLCARNRVGNKGLLDEVDKWGVVVYQRSTSFEIPMCNYCLR